MGGEKYKVHVYNTVNKGSPPRRRGKAEEPREPGTFDRITPAWAGKSAALCQLYPGYLDHPRVGGEKFS